MAGPVFCGYRGVARSSKNMKLVVIVGVCGLIFWVIDWADCWTVGCLPVESHASKLPPFVAKRIYAVSIDF